MWDSSVVRRSVVLLCLVVPGLILNFALSIFAAELLTTEKFGLFYLGLSIANILAAPSAVVAFYMARAYADYRMRHGEEAMWASVLESIPKYALGILLGALLLSALIVPFASLTDFGSPLLVTIVCFLGLSTYLIEIVRGALKATQKFAWLGVFSLCWMTGRFVMGISAIWITAKVWIALIGVMASSAISTLVFYAIVRLRTKSQDVDPPPVDPWRIRSALPFALGYTFAFAIAYLDIFVGYVVLDKTAFGMYTASSVIPKGLYTLTLPVMQVMFPTIGATQATSLSRSVATRGLALTLFMTISGAVVVYFAAPHACGDTFRIGSCQSDVLTILAFAIPAIALLRGAVLIKLAQKRDMHSLLLILPIGLFIGYEWISMPDANRLAMDFALFALGVLLFYALTFRVGRQGHTDIN